jgi:hypothetical protein
VDPAKPARKEPPDQAKVLETVRTILGADSILYICVGSAGNSMRLTGEFRSAWGSLSVNDEVPRDLNVVESVKGVVLKYTDVVKQKEEAKAAALQKEKDDYAAWVAGVTAALDLAERELMVRGRKWEIAGEAKKAELFGRTAGEVAALRQCAAAAEETRLADAEAGKKAFSGCTREWELLEPKVRSLLAWDVDAAVRAKEVREIEALSARAATGLAEVRKLFNEKKPLLAKPEAKRFGDEVKGLEKAMKEADKLGRKDPLSRERRRLLYKVLITEAELTRLLSLR